MILINSPDFQKNFLTLKSRFLYSWSWKFQRYLKAYRQRKHVFLEASMLIGMDYIIFYFVKDTKKKQSTLPWFSCISLWTFSFLDFFKIGKTPKWNTLLISHLFLRSHFFSFGFQSNSLLMRQPYLFFPRPRTSSMNAFACWMLSETQEFQKFTKSPTLSKDGLIVITFMFPFNGSG